MFCTPHSWAQAECPIISLAIPPCCNTNPAEDVLLSLSILLISLTDKSSSLDCHRNAYRWSFSSKPLLTCFGVQKRTVTESVRKYSSVNGGHHEGQRTTLDDSTMHKCCLLQFSVFKISICNPFGLTIPILACHIFSTIICTSVFLFVWIFLKLTGNWFGPWFRQ